jgi:ubiquinone/menaquinone biosynthesis C-methylase UbiE
LVLGIDISEEIVTAAQHHLDNAGLPVEFQIGDVHNLEFNDGVFHGCRADRVFQHISDRELALAEMIRVTQSGGWIVAMDPDWETLVVDAPKNADLTRKILNYIADHAATNGWTGRQLFRLFKQATLLEVSVDSATVILTEFSIASPIMYLESAVQEMVEKGTLAADAGSAWRGYLQKADKAGHFFSAMTGFTVCGQKP